ncbi:MAG: DUF2568 domain-containing protein [Candidatus Nanopelagicales bacterium]
MGPCSHWSSPCGSRSNSPCSPSSRGGGTRWEGCWWGPSARSASRSCGGFFFPPKARFPLPTQVRNAVEVAVFLLAAAGLSALGHPALGVVLIAADVLILLTLWRLGATTGGEPVG